jgi:phosphoglycerate dehydrogenase-like enzyme
MQIVFHGFAAAAYRDGFEACLGRPAEIATVAEEPTGADAVRYAAADVIVGNRFDARLPRPERLRLFHVPGAGYEAVALDLLPPGAVVCNCFGHGGPIAEYVMAAILADAVPLAAADQQLRAGEWAYRAGAAGGARDEVAGRTIGLLGFGHIARAVLPPARALGLRVHAASRRGVDDPGVDRGFTFAELPAFWASADIFVIAVPLAAETLGIVGRAAFAAMREEALLINVARGPVVDEEALFDALSRRRIRKAVIDTWYTYPAAGERTGRPAHRAFEALDNVVMTPHMSGWSTGTIRRRQQAIAENIRRCADGLAYSNVIRPDRIASPDRPTD